MLVLFPGCCCLPGEDANLLVSQLDQLEEQLHQAVISQVECWPGPGEPLDPCSLLIQAGFTTLAPGAAARCWGLQPSTYSHFGVCLHECVCLLHHIFIQKRVLPSFLNCDVSFFHVSFLNVFSAWRTIPRSSCCHLTVDGLFDRLSVKGITDTTGWISWFIFVSV